MPVRVFVLIASIFVSTSSILGNLARPYGDGIAICDIGEYEAQLGIFYRDADGDGYGDPNDWSLADSAPQSYVSDNTDCDGTNPDINPGATEVCDDIVDEGFDADGDGYTTCDGDCDDSNANVNPRLGCGQRR